MVIALSIISFIFLILHIQQSETNLHKELQFIDLKREVDKLRADKLKFKKGDYVEYNGVKCFISSINVDRCEYVSSWEMDSFPYLVSGPNISKYLREDQLKLLKCKKEN